MGDTFSYALVSGDGTNDVDNALVEIDGNQVKVKSGASIDYVANPVLDLNIQVTDNGGLTFTKAVTASVIDGIAPEAPSFALAGDTGSSNSDGITSNGTIIVSGLEASASWQYSTNSGSDWFTGTGDSFTLPEADYASGSIQVRQSDAAGNLSAIALNPTAITVDTTAPSSNPTVATIIEGAGGDVILVGGISSGSAPLVVRGTLSEPLALGESVRILDGSTELGLASVLADSTSWTFTDRRPLATGQSVQYTARAIDLAGNQSASSAAYSVTQSPTLPVISVQDVSIVEGETGTSKQAVFTITLSRVSDQPISLTYTFLPGTATASTDYAAAIGPQTLTINPGLVSRTIAFTVNGDEDNESDETLSLQLSNPSGATFTAGSTTAITATGTIINDDITPVDPDQGITITSSGNFAGTGKNDQLTGDGGANQIQGLAGNDLITGLGGADVLSGGSGADTFRYEALSESTLSAMDSLTDFNGTLGDKLELPAPPGALYNRGTIAASSLAAAMQQAYADKDTGIAGNQALLSNEVVLFSWGTSSRRLNTYLSISDGNDADFSGDFLVKLPANPGFTDLSIFV